MEQLKMGIIGTGLIASAMAQTVAAMENAKVVAVASRQEVTAEAFARKHDVAKYYDSYQALATDPDVDLVYIASPHSHHFQHGMLCLEHGKPVLCEKAFTTNAFEAQTMLEYAEKRNLFITEAVWTRYMPLVKTIQQLIESGTIGEPLMVTANHGQDLRHIDRLTNPNLAGGALLDLTVYPINLAAIALGPDVQDFTSDMDLWDTGVDASETIVLHYGQRRNAVLCGTLLNRMSEQWFVYGSEGALAVDGLCNPSAVSVLDKNGVERSRHKRPPQNTGYEYEVQACISALAEGRIECPEMPHAETLRIMHLMDGLRDSWGLRYPFET